MSEQVNDNVKTGYVKTYRSLANHWLYEKARKRTKYEAWLDLIFKACHKDCKEPIGIDRIIVTRGQILTSQESLATDWKWDRGSVRRFLSLLEKDEMIELKTTSKYTMITVCKYDTYNPLKPSDRTSNEHQTNTYNNVKELNKENIYAEVFSFDYCEQMKLDFLSYWRAPILKGKYKGKEKWETQDTFSLAGRLSTWFNNGKDKYTRTTIPESQKSDSDKHYEKVDKKYLKDGVYSYKEISKTSLDSFLYAVYNKYNLDLHYHG